MQKYLYIASAIITFLPAIIGIFGVIISPIGPIVKLFDGFDFEKTFYAIPMGLLMAFCISIYYSHIIGAIIIAIPLIICVLLYIFRNDIVVG